MNSYCLKSKKDTKNIHPRVSGTSNGKVIILSKCGNLLWNATSLSWLKMNKIVNKFLLAVDNFMPEMRLKQPGFTYSAFGPFTKNKERIQKFKERGNINYIYKNELDKACFEHDMAYGDFKDLARRAASDKFLRDKAFNIAKNHKYDGYQRGLASMVYKFFDKKSARRQRC